MQETMPAMTANYDAILIGSGIGALTVAVGPARQKRWRCLILEQNFNLGGMTQEFVRERRYHFDVGLHYVGEMTQGTFTRRLMDYVTGGAVEWAPMPDIFERFVPEQPARRLLSRAFSARAPRLALRPLPDAGRRPLSDRRSDVMSCGIVGAMMGGLKCLAVILGGKEFLHLMRGLNFASARSQRSKDKGA